MDVSSRSMAAIGLSAAAAAAAAAMVLGRPRRRDEWEATLERVLPAIVVIRVNYVKPFDGDQAGSSHATGFVVDSKRGIILTNRHVIGCGPVRAEATFVNKEEVALTPLYRDPVHDFGFFHFDAKELKYTSSAAEIELAPSAAKVGLEIRVVGNDAGEKVSILSGTLARLDRNAPHYQSDGYNDFNTFYFMAASNTAGGSSGSPVLDSRGRAVALNAGGSNSSSASYYLPLHSVKRALDALRNPPPLPKNPAAAAAAPPRGLPPRGTLRVVWRYQTCDEMRRLALSRETEAALRAQHASQAIEGRSPGLLVVEQIVRGGSGEKAGLEVGDILVRVALGEEKLDVGFPGFDELEAALDEYSVVREVNDSGGGGGGGAQKPRKVALTVERGGRLVTLRGVASEDLHELSPHEFVEFGGGVLHALSYGAVRNGNLALESGVYVAFSGFVLDAAGVPAHSVVTALGDEATPSLAAFERVAAALTDGERVTLRFYNIGDQYNEQIAMLRVNCRWFSVLRWTRRDPPLALVAEKCAHGTADAAFRACWSSRVVTAAPRRLGDVATANAVAAATATFQRPHASAPANSAVSSLCKVSFDVLHAIDGVHDWHFVGCGLVVDAERGLVVVDRNTVVTSLGDISVTFAAAVELPAKLVFVHPTHNFALIRYDASAFATAPAFSRPTSARLGPRQLAVGDELQFVGLCRTNPDQSLSQKVCITEISCVNIAQAHVPRFRALNEEIAKFDQVVNKSLGGVLVDLSGAIAATWSCYSFYSWNDEKNYEAFHAVGVDVVHDVVQRLFSNEAASLAKSSGAAHNNEDPAASSSSSSSKRRPVIHSIGFGLKRLPLSTARTSMKLEDAWVAKLQQRHPSRSQVLSVAQLAHADARPVLTTQVDDDDDDDAEDTARADDCAAADLVVSEEPDAIVEGDLLLAIDGEPTATFRDVEHATRDRETVDVTIWRDGAARCITLKTEAIESGAGTERVVVWCGLLLQAPHRAVREMGAPRTGVYISYYLYGSPAHFYSIKACRFIVEVNGTRVDDLDGFVAAVAGIADGAPVRLKTSDLQGQAVATTLKTDYSFWPSHHFLFADGDWRCERL